MGKSQTGSYNVQFSFKVKLIICLSIVILLIFCVSGYISYHIQLRLFEEEISRQFLKANEQGLARLDLRIQNVIRTSNYIAFHPYVEDIIKRSSNTSDESTFNQYLNRQELLNLLNQFTLETPNLSALYLYNLSGERFYLSKSLSVNTLDEERYLEIANRLRNTEGKLIWKRTTLSSPIEESGFRNVIIASRLMRTKQLDTYGILIMVFDERIFSQFLSELTERDSGVVYLFDQENQLLYTDDEHIDPSYMAELDKIDQTTIQSVDNTPFLFAKSDSGESSFSLVSRVSLKDLQAQSRIIFKIALYSGILGAIIACLLVVFTSTRLLSPLKKLIQGMRQLRDGDFEVQVQINTRDEWAYIGQSFNSMAANIHSLIKEVYERQLSEREAEMKALQAQINPHFLYNTLDMIYWNLYLKDEIEVADLVISLSEMLRYSLEPIHETATLSDEIQQIRNYFHIQKARFQDDLQTTIEINEDVQNCSMIRFLIQPLVENVFVHAFHDKQMDKMITIRAFRQEPDQLVVEVVDNGCGIEEKKVALLTKEKNDDRKRTSLGINSVIRRIALSYGEPYGLEIFSKRGCGTKMKLILPYQTASDEIEKEALVKHEHIQRTHC